MNKDQFNISLYKEDEDIGISADQSILDATLAAGLNHMHACGGHGRCSTCRINVLDGIEHCIERNADEQKMAEMLNFPDKIRLACQTKLKGDVTIRRIVTDQIDLEIIDQQFADDSGAALGQERKLAIVFTDIVNYTKFAERFPSYDIVHVLNRYYKTMNNVIQKHSGIISDVAGDGILAIFGTDEDTYNPVQDAVEAVKEMNMALQEFNKYLKGNYDASFDFRAGIHYGKVIVGPFDTGAMKKIAVIGDAVNYASRIETANKEFGTRVLLSEEAYHSVKDQYQSNNSYTANLKGKTGEYKLFEVSL